MLVCDKCKQPITEPFNRIIFKMTRVVGTELTGDTQKVMMPPTPKSREIGLDICADCQEKIIKDILGELPWKDGK